MSLIAHTIKGSTDGADVTTDAIDTTGADFILLTTSMFDSYGNTITDSYGNSYGPAVDLPLFSALISFLAATQSYVCYNPTVGPGHTFSCTTNNKKPAIAVSAWSGVSVDVENGQHTSASGTSIGYASITPPAADTLILLTLARNTASAAAPSAGFTLLGEVDPSGTNVGLNHAYMLTPDTSAVVPGWTWPTSSVDRGGGFGVFAYEEPPSGLETFFLFGENTDTKADRTMTLGLDGETNVATEPGKFKVFGRGEFTGDLKVIDPVAAQDAVPKHYCDANSTGIEDIVGRLLVTEDGALVLDDDGVPLYSEG